ncbi:MAG: hypothetical protein ACK5N8_08695 [Alphaproteobacteria bacterium]
MYLINKSSEAVKTGITGRINSDEILCESLGFNIFNSDKLLKDLAELYNIVVDDIIYNKVKSEKIDSQKALAELLTVIGIDAQEQINHSLYFDKITFDEIAKQCHVELVQAYFMHEKKPLRTIEWVIEVNSLDNQKQKTFTVSLDAVLTFRECTQIADIPVAENEVLDISRCELETKMENGNLVFTAVPHKEQLFIYKKDAKGGYVLEEHKSE